MTGMVAESDSGPAATAVRPDAGWSGMSGAGNRRSERAAPAGR
jgi:hypothetical protein